MKACFCTFAALVALSLAVPTATLLAADTAAEKAFGTLRGEVVDSVTGLPTPCTVTIVDANGKTISESESFRGGFRSNGQFTKSLPAGRTRLRVTRGFETRVVEKVVDVPASEAVELKIALERVVDLRKRHWFAGDSHVHMLHGEKTVPVTFDYVALTAQAEDLQYLSLCQTWTLQNSTPENLLAKLGPLSRPNCLVTWNLEAPKNYYRGDAGRCLGHCWTLGMNGRTPSGDDVIKVLLEASAHDFESQKPPTLNFESHQLIHTQGGSVFYTHPARWWTGSWGGQGGYPKQERMRISNMAVELPLDVLVGPTFDGVDIITGSGEYRANALAFELWALLLNHGYRLAGTAASDSCFDRPGGGVPGVARTYTYLGDGFSLAGIAKAMAEGHNFVSTGPLLLASIDGQPPGTIFTPNNQAARLQIEAWPCGTDSKGLTRLELLRNGKIIQTNQLGGVSNFITNIALTEVETAWYCVRLFGGDPQRQQAISGAFFFQDKDFRSPAPVPARVHVKLLDAQTGREMAGSITEVIYQGTLPVTGKIHTHSSEAVLTLPATVRLKADSPGYQSVILSPILDNPALSDFITRLSAEDLVKWETFEHIKSLLGQISLTFKLEKQVAKDQ